MANSQSPLPEGTDSIVPGASNQEIDRSGDYAGAPSFGAASSDSKTDEARAKLGDAVAKVGDATSSLRAQATDKARDYATQGKDRAVGALDSVTRLVDEAAGTIDEKVGEQYGAYARKASEAVAGLADTLRNRDIDELFAEAGDAVRKSPAIAIGAAAAIGFVIARLLKSGASERGTARSATTPTTATTVPVDPSL